MSAAQRAFQASDYGTAVPRAHYAAYHAVIASFEVGPTVTRPQWSHYLAPNLRRIAGLHDVQERLWTLYLARIRADYGDMTLSIAEAEAALSGAGALPVRKSTVHKSRAAIKQAVELPWCGLAGRYPGLSLETIEGPGDGYNAWLRVYLPKNLTSQRQDVQHTAFVLADEFDNKTSIAVLPIVQEKEPVHG